MSSRLDPESPLSYQETLLLLPGGIYNCIQFPPSKEGGIGGNVVLGVGNNVR